jgi:hypothetical protein
MIKEQLWQKKGLLLDLAIIIAFSIFLMDELLQDTTTCLGQLTCFGIPDMFTHSISYTILYLRAGIHPWGSHWFSELLVPLMFFFLMFYTKSVRFAFIVMPFFWFWHEMIWTTFEYYYTGILFAVFPSIFWISLECAFLAIIFKMFPKVFFTKRFFILTIPWILFCFYWGIFYGMNVTVGSVKYASGIYLTPYYHSFAINGLEVGGWILCFIIVITNIILAKRAGVRFNYLG